MTQLQRSLSSPTGVHPPVGRYSHMARVKASELLFLAGQVSLDEDGNLVGKGDMATQTRQAYRNIGKILESAGATFANVVQVTTCIVGQESVGPYMDGRSTVFDEVYPNGENPPNTLLVVNGLVDEGMLIEVVVIAALP